MPLKCCAICLRNVVFLKGERFAHSVCVIFSQLVWLTAKPLKVMGGMQPAERRRRAGALPNFFQAKYQIMWEKVQYIRDFNITGI